MIKTFALAFTTLSFLFYANTSFAQSASDQTAIAKTLFKYEKALNNSDIDAVLALYAADGVFMMPGARPAIGSTALENAYQNVFNMIKLNIRFDLNEIVTLADGWAFARTTSSGTVQILKDKNIVPEANQELFILKQQDGGQWKIVRYAFSKTELAN